MEWLLHNWVPLVEGIGLVLTGLSIITGLTPTPKDDEILGKIIGYFSFVKPRNAVGSLKLPFTKVKS